MSSYIYGNNIYDALVSMIKHMYFRMHTDVAPSNQMSHPTRNPIGVTAITVGEEEYFQEGLGKLEELQKFDVDQLFFRRCVPTK